MENVNCQQALPWINEVQSQTKAHAAHTLFLGIGGEPRLGLDAARAGSLYYEQQQRHPSLDELIEYLYGESLPPADFFIMSSKLGGLGALPALICGKDTEVYYLPVPGVLGLTRQTYRAILFDLLYVRGGMSADTPYALTQAERKTLGSWYLEHRDTVIGLGHSIGRVSVPDIPESEMP